MRLTVVWTPDPANVASCAYPLCGRQALKVGLSGRLARARGWSFGASDDSWCPRHRGYRPRRRERKQRGYAPHAEN